MVNQAILFSLIPETRLKLSCNNKYLVGLFDWIHWYNPK